MPKRRALVVVSKCPVPGEVKTRLIARLGAVQAARVASVCLENVLSVGRSTSADDHILYIRSPHLAPDSVCALAAQTGWRIVEQTGLNLADVLANAFMDLSGTRSHHILAVVGDIPSLTRRNLDWAYDQLDQGSDVVVGASPDGGFWSVGFRDRENAEVLSRVAMSTSDTRLELIQRCTDRGLSVTVGEDVPDVDVPEDLESVSALCPPDSGFSRLVASLQDESHNEAGTSQLGRH